jgi:hypothetical protein
VKSLSTTGHVILDYALCSDSELLFRLMSQVSTGLVPITETLHGVDAGSVHLVNCDEHHSIASCVLFSLLRTVPL